jgi:hypothetical protein
MIAVEIFLQLRIANKGSSVPSAHCYFPERQAGVAKAPATSPAPANALDVARADVCRERIWQLIDRQIGAATKVAEIWPLSHVYPNKC